MLKLETLPRMESVALLLGLAGVLQLLGQAGTCSGNVLDFQNEVRQCDKELKLLMGYKLHRKFLHDPSYATLDLLCKGYEKWDNCLRETADRCGIDQTRLNAIIGATKSEIIVTCTTHKQDMTRQLSCLTSQTREVNPLYRGCYSLMDMQLKSGVFDKCRTVQKYASCQDRLVRTSCGSDVADFLHALSLDVELPQLTNQRECLVPENMPPSKGFHYSLKCPPDFPVQMIRCYDTNFRGRLSMRSETAGVLQLSSVSAVNNLCRSLTVYQDCMSELESRCPSGVQAVYESEMDWHKLIKMAESLCSMDTKPQYSRYLPCYSRLLGSSSSTSLCGRLYRQTASKMEVHTLACNPSSRYSQRIVRERQELVQCFQSSIKKRCGISASELIQPLLNLQYSLDVLPSCGATEAPPRVDCLRSSGDSWRTQSISFCHLLFSSVFVLLVPLDSFSPIESI